MDREELKTRPLVAPRAGAWIEMGQLPQHPMPGSVAPRAGAWIEIDPAGTGYRPAAVAPRAGAWIEMGEGL